jgi:uncharacterized repeat protein (TIGR03803 family)
MNTKTNCKTLTHAAPTPILTRWAVRRLRPALSACLLTGLVLAAPAQDFYNLDFEQAVLIPVTSGPYGRVQFAPALPGWAGYCGTDPQTLANYNFEYLDSAGISIIDTNCYTNTYAPVPPGFIHGRFCALIQSGNLYPVDTFIAQTGTVPPDAKSILFNASYLASEERLVLTFNGTPVPLAVLGLLPNQMALGGVVSQFAGQTGELRFTSPVLWYTEPPGIQFPSYGPVTLDYIRFSTTPLAAPPVILVPPSSQTCNMGSTVDFDVSATGCPEPVCQWWFNTTNLIQGAMSPILELTKVQFSQAGSYILVLSNAYGVVTSPPAILTVYDPFITNQPASQSSDAKQTASFSVGAGGTTPLSFQWLKNGVTLSDQGRLSGARTSMLTISNVLGADAGSYSVIVSNHYGSVISQPATLTVHDPLIVVQPVSQTVASGGNAVFSVVADGTAPFRYQWFNAGVRLNDGPNISGTQTPTLTLANALGGEADAYWVVVANAYLSVTSQVAFVSMSPPLYSVLHHFANSAGSPYSPNPNAALVSCGRTLYGTGEASVFKINTDGTGFTRITSRIEGANGGLVLAGLTLYGATYSGSDPGQLYRVNTNGSGFAVLKSFTGGFDGGEVYAAPVLSGSVLYGTAGSGGSSGYGTVFKVNTDGSDFTVLRAFDYTAEDPRGALAISGNTLYGTLTSDYVNGVAGKVFKINTDGSGFAILQQFNGDDGRYPLSRLVLSGDTLYGTTLYGGTATLGNGSGTVFKFGTNSPFAVLKAFAGGSDGANPSGDIVVSGRTLYGTTSTGGISNYGTIFKIDIDGSNYTVLKRFRGSDGANPSGGLVMSGGTLCGTTSLGGISNNGVIFALSVPAAPTVLNNPPSQTAEVGSVVVFGTDISGYAPSFQWFFNGTHALGSATTNPVLQLTGIQPAQAGAYTVVVTNAFGAVTSAPAFLSVIPLVERRRAPAIGLAGQAGMVLNLEYADPLTPSLKWLPLATVPLASTPQFYFDLSAPLPPQRIFRAWQTGASSVPPVLDLHMIPAITLTGAIGSSVRVDCINQFGPTDAWATLAIVALTNSPQLYFDSSTIGQPPRLYRLFPIP